VSLHNGKTFTGVDCKNPIMRQLEKNEQLIGVAHLFSAKIQRPSFLAVLKLGHEQ
jgi:hypothetical protein